MPLIQPGLTLYPGLVYLLSSHSAFRLSLVSQTVTWISFPPVCVLPYLTHRHHRCELSGQVTENIVLTHVFLFYIRGYCCVFVCLTFTLGSCLETRRIIYATTCYPIVPIVIIVMSCVGKVVRICCYELMMLFVRASIAYAIHKIVTSLSCSLMWKMYIVTHIQNSNFQFYVYM